MNKEFSVLKLCLLFVVLTGVTVAGYGNGTSGLSAMGLYGPCSVHVLGNGIMYVTDRGNNRIQKFPAGSRLGITLLGNGTADSTSTELNTPMGLYVDASTQNVYIADYYNSRIQRVGSINITLQGQTIADYTSSTIEFYAPTGVRLDAQGNLYVADMYYAQIIRWPSNSYIGTVIAGTGSVGSNASSFDWPDKFDFDASGHYMYIPDRNNNRVQKWKIPLNGSAPATAGVTVAGGNGSGILPNQLNSPHSVYVSKKTDALYIADSANNRIQLWYVNATQGITIAGSPQGVAGVGPNDLYYPEGVFLDANETYMYVADQGNNRVQQFTLI